MKREDLCRICHEMMSGLKQGLNEPKYERWQSLPQSIKDLYDGAFKLIEANGKGKTTPAEIHDYWIEWAKIHSPAHPSIAPYDELSQIEKLKDVFIVNIIETLLF